MTLDEFIQKYTGKGIDVDGKYGNQCVDLYRQYVKEVLNYPQSPGVVGAKDIWDTYLSEYFDRIPNTPEGIPQAGDIMIWGATYGPYGHVAVVKSATLTTFTCFSQNDPTGVLCGIKTYRTYKPTLGWLHPKKGTMNPDEIAVKKTDFERLVKKSSDYDAILAKYSVADSQGLFSYTAGLSSRITDLTNQLGTAQAEQKNKEEIISRLEQNLIAKGDDINSLMSRLDQCSNTVAQLGKDKGNLAIEVEQLKIQVETLKQAQAEGGVTLTLADLFKLIWQQKITIKKG